MKVLLFSLVMMLTASAFSQDVYTPEKGSEERKAIFESLRPMVERELGQKIVFVADTFNVTGTWAFISGSLQSPDGGSPDFSRTEYREAINAGAFDNNYFALLKKTRGKWTVKKYAIGCTDVCYLPWPEEFNAPKAIFPYVE